MFKRVDFPEPEGPMTANNSPLEISKDRSCSAIVLAPPVPKVFEILNNEIMCLFLSDGTVQIQMYEPDTGDE